MVVEVGVALPLKPVYKANYAGEVGKVGVIQQLCKTNIGSASVEVQEGDRNPSIYLG